MFILQKLRFIFKYKEISLWKIIITGALGQIGTELVIKCRERYGTENVLATDIRKPEPHSPVKTVLLKS